MSLRSDAGVLRALDDPGDDRDQQRARRGGTLGAARAAEDELLEPAILALELLHPDEQADEAVPRILAFGRGAGGLRHLPDAVLEQRVDQQLLVGEAAVDGAYADACLARDVVVRAAQPALGEDDAGGLEDALAVALGVAAQRALGGWSLRAHATRIAESGDIFSNRRNLSTSVLRSPQEVENRPPLYHSGAHAMTSPTNTSADSHRWWILALIGLAQLMVVLDATIVNIALPSAQEALGFSNDARQWVVTSYALAFGSLLLLGGRLGDFFGRKRVFVIGLTGFAVASALGGVAESFGVLVAARALQGAFARAARPGRARPADHDLHRSRRSATARSASSA